ncbi:antibiotic biosynthesis monooxygenase [Microbispora sp. NBC_01189]|uniref:antibiotic biosynthesis monooxygenase family protein n=1 Tax=unclassified Microbispora TaxID=2614687 RepID=UPI002E113A5D|nr:antibiotic biosynthesis monooxygenase [Microbispora sp. NBC_01189]
MTETVIRVDDQVVTFINVFDVDPSKQQELIAILNEGAEKVMRHRPGFISVNVLAGADGTRVVNLAQWRTPDDLRATAGDPEAQVFAKRAAEIAKAAPQPYKVVSVYHA